MEDYIWILAIISIFILWGIISWVRETISNSRRYLELKPRLDNLEKSIKERELKLENSTREHEAKVEKDRKNWISKVELWNQKIGQDKEEVKKIAAQKSMGFPWLAEVFAEYFALRDSKFEKYLDTKKHPAYTAAEIVREVKNEKKLLRKENKILSYKIKYFEKLFPWLAELIAEDENEEIPVRIDDDTADDDNKDRVKDFLTPEEYKQLPSVERNQKALDRYLESRNKSKWAIGRDYEMYVGYSYEQKGYSVEYKGIVDKFDDLGRDIIAKKGNEVCIIQCKYWSRRKEIHEAHIFQLFGTTMEYWIDNFNNHNLSLFSHKPKTFEEFAKFLHEDRIRPIIFTSISLSDKARKAAKALSVEIVENEPIGEFPRIKCNINHDEFGNTTKIYHLPMDQQYDKTIITKSKGEFYAFTVKEAEDAGFRRAFKHKFQP